MKKERKNEKVKMEDTERERKKALLSNAAAQTSTADGKSERLKSKQWKKFLLWFEHF